MSPCRQKPRSVAGVHAAPVSARAGDRGFTSLTAAAYLLFVHRGPRRTTATPATAAHLLNAIALAARGAKFVRWIAWAEQARKDKDAQFTALCTTPTLAVSGSVYLEPRRKAAAAADGVTWHEYELDLEANLRGLHPRVRLSGEARERAYIQKRDGRLRSLGGAALEDKVGQRAVVEVLNYIYDADLLGFSYGFLPGRPPHHELDALANRDQTLKGEPTARPLTSATTSGASIVDGLRSFLEHQIAEPRVLRLNQKWLAAGVIEDGAWERPSREPCSGRVFRHSLPTPTCIMCSTSGTTHGDGTTRAGR